METKQKKASIRPFPESIADSSLLQHSHRIRSPNKKLTTCMPQNTLESTKSIISNQRPGRTSKHRHKTFAGPTLQSKPLYKLANNDERKVLLLLGLVQQFIQDVELKRRGQQQVLKKKKCDRRKMFNLTSSQSQFKVIEPLSSGIYEQQQAYSFFCHIRNTIKDSYRHKFFQQMKKSKLNLEHQITPKQSSTKELNPNIHKSRSSINVSKSIDLEKHFTLAFITNTNTNNEFNKSSQSVAFSQPRSQLMGGTQLSQQMRTLIRNAKSQEKSKFKILKVKSLKTRMRIHPVANRYQSRKKQQIRTFMQLNEKTEHLENFRSEEGKFFKFNQNLKISVKSVNMCRVTLLSKRNALIKQLGRLGDDAYFNEKNKKLKSIRERNECKIISNLNPKDHPPPEQKGITCSQRRSEQIGFTAYKQKAIRIMNYFQQTTKYFRTIQLFLLQFLKSDKSYQNYLHENEIKQRLKQNLKQTQMEKFYDNFTDACFHMSQISRIYFNIINQLSYFHHSVHIQQYKFVTKEGIQKATKTIIQLRYAIIYLQKQCENTTESVPTNNKYQIDVEDDFLNNDHGSININNNNNYNNYNSNSNRNGNNDFTKTAYNSHQPSQRSKLPQVQKKYLNNHQLPNSNLTSVLKQLDHRDSLDHLKQPAVLSLDKVNSKLQINTLMLRSTDNTLKKTPSQVTGKSLKKKKLQTKMSSITSSTEEKIDLNEIWKTFYNKKFSSNAMRLRLY